MRLHRLTICALALGAMLLGGAGPPGVGAGVRVPVDVSAAPWSSLVRVQIPGVSRCTGVVVAPRLVLTAAHCLFSLRAAHFAPPASIHVLTGYARGDFAFHTVAVTYRIAPGWRPDRGAPALGADAAIVVLADSLSAPALPLTDAASGPVRLGGYNQDRAELLEADPDCRILGRAADAAGRPLLRHDCAATRGTSGAPLLVQTANGWAIAGLQVAVTTGRGGAAVPAAALRPLLAAGIHDSPVNSIP
jgi:protease YdgD